MTIDDAFKTLIAWKFPDGGKLEFNINADGLHVVGNRDGYEALAKWCSGMAALAEELSYEPDVAYRGQGIHFGDYAGKTAVSENRIVFSNQPIRHLQKPLDESARQDIFFHASETVGTDYWGEDAGSSPEWVKLHGVLD